MAENVKPYADFLKAFSLPESDLRTYSPLTLAYLGDAVYEIAVRTILVKRGNRPVGALHREAASLVRAGRQAEIAEKIEASFTSEEADVYRRGKNAHSSTMAKHAEVAEYRKATGLEAVFGYLFLKEEFERITDLLEAALRDYLLSEKERR